MPKSLNVSPVSYRNWLALVFDHAVPEREENGLPNLQARWHNQDGVHFHVSNGARLVSHMTRLCREFASVADSYTLEQIDQGLWFLLSSGGEVEFGEYLADSDIALQARLDCVRSMVHPYSDFVGVSQVEVMENCFEMWWDLLLTSYWGAQTRRFKAEELSAANDEFWQDSEAAFKIADFLANVSWDDDFNTQLEAAGLSSDDLRRGRFPEVTYDELDAAERQVTDTMLETLAVILKLDDDRTQLYALHGLNHLPHPKRSQVVQEYIDTFGDDYTSEGIEWMERCRDGEAM